MCVDKGVCTMCQAEVSLIIGKALSQLLLNKEELDFK